MMFQHFPTNGDDDGRAVSTPAGMLELWWHLYFNSSLQFLAASLKNVQNVEIEF